MRGLCQNLIADGAIPCAACACSRRVYSAGPVRLPAEPSHATWRVRSMLPMHGQCLFYAGVSDVFPLISF